jgi:hypothetical protein
MMYKRPDPKSGNRQVNYEHINYIDDLNQIHNQSIENVIFRK